MLGRRLLGHARSVARRGLAARNYSLSTTLLEDLTQRGFVQNVTRSEALHNALDSGRHVVYAGVDPTAKALHIGHLIPLMCLLHFQIRGHQIIPLIGGATGLIGDPSGRLSERQPADAKQIEYNVVSLTENVNGFFKRALCYADARIEHDAVRLEPSVKSNLQWHHGINMLEFLQKVGVHARVNTMLNRESVRTRLDSQQGISFTEFTYQLLQAYDFYYLHKHFNCSIQVGGSDQWGNILAGLELINRLNVTTHADLSTPSQTDAYGITTPLLTTSTGEKFGKSAGNAIWLDPNMTSVFDFYQYFLKVADADAEKYLKLFTLLSPSQISQIMSSHSEQPDKRIAQRRLADEVTEMVHTGNGLARAKTLTSMLFDSDYSGIKAQNIIAAFENDSRLVMLDETELLETPIIKLASKYGLVSSTSAARSLVLSRGLYCNNVVAPEPQFKIPQTQLIEGRVAILRAGKDKLLVLTCNEK